MAEPASKTRVASVEWIRVFAAACVVMFHFEQLYFGEHRYFENMAVVVDFFFLLSGFLLMKSVVTKKAKEQQARALASSASALAAPASASTQTTEGPTNSLAQSLAESLLYVFRKAKSFYPAYLLAFIMVFILTTITMQMTDFGEIMARLFHFKWEALLLQMAGFIPDPHFNVDYLVGSAWYLSAMLLAMIPVYFLARHCQKAYTNAIAPLAALFVYCFFMQSFGTINAGNEMVGFVMSGTLRAFAGLSVGCICCALYERVSAAKWSRAATVGASIIEVLCILSVACLILLRGWITAPDLLFWVPVFAVLVFFCFCSKTAVARLLNTRAVRVAVYLGKLSLYVYLFHWFFVLFFVQYVQGLDYLPGQLAYGTCVVLFSAAMMFLFERLGRYFKSRRLQAE